MFEISPIGSCRITTPLKNGQKRHGFRLNLARCYGYCHSPAEAVQQARFMMGEADIPASVWPFVSRSHNLSSLSKQKHIPSDLYVVELSSAKEVTIDGISVQLNYLRTAFSAFFDETNRAQTFWMLAQGDQPYSALREFLDRNWSETERQRIDSETLCRIRLHLVTRESLRRDITTLKSILPEVLFVSHVNARKPDGSEIGSRAHFINLVREEVTAHGYYFYDPTDLMEECGQAFAIEDESTGLAHFTPRFGDALMDEWAAQFVIQTTEKLISANSRSRADAMVEHQVNAALCARDSLRAHRRLAATQAEIAQTLHDRVVDAVDAAQSRVLSSLEQIDAASLSAENVLRLSSEAAAAGLFDVIADLSARSIEGLHAIPTHTLINMALRAAEYGNRADAFELALAAMQRAPHLPRPRALLIEIALSEGFNLLGILTEQQASELLPSLDAHDRLDLLYLAGMSAADAVTQDWTASDVLEIASILSDRGELDQAAQVLGAWRKAHEHHRIRDEALLALLDEWVSYASKLEHTAERLQTLTSLAEACPRHPEIRIAVRDMRVALVGRIRAAGRAGNLETLEELAAEVGALSMPLPEFDLWRARLLFDRGAYESVLDLAPVARDHLSNRIGVWVLLMRAAQKAERSGDAQLFAREVVKLSNANTQKLKIEAETVLSSEVVRP